MNNNTPAFLRSLIIYALCVPLAAWFGYIIAQQWDRSTFGIFAALALILATPIFLRWHHPLLVLSLNLEAIIFFLPGTPNIWMPMICLSLGISVLHRTLNSEARFISAPQITWPLICLAAVVLFTAELTGGFGLRSLGSETMGSRRYFTVLVAILGYFALTAQRIPPNRVKLYVALFYLATCACVIGDTASFLPSPLRFIFLIFPADNYAIHDQLGPGMSSSRLSAVSSVAMAIFTFMLARYGIRGIFMSGRPSRILLFLMFSVLILYGGFRLSFITCALIFFTQFYLERLYQTRLLVVFAFIGVIVVTLCVPFANKLPYTFQRSLAFLPLKIDPEVKWDAESSSNWRVMIWKAMLPQVPHYLLLGKGYQLTALDFQEVSTTGLSSGASVADWSATIVGNYHNGPLSVVIFFGIWGVMAFVWFLTACGRALYDNYRYGDPSLLTVNTLLFASFIAKTIAFLFVFGAFESDMLGFASIIGFSISLNGGIRQPAKTTVQESPRIPAPNQLRFQPYYQR